MTVIRDALERPVPPQDIIDALKRVDDRLELRYVAYKHLDYANLNRDEKWAIIERWTADNPRRRMIQLGQMAEDADFDVLCYLPLDCPVEEAFGFFEKAVRGQFRDRKKDLERMVSRLHHFNAQITEEAKQETKELAEELISTNAPTLFKKEGKDTPKVYQK